MNTKASCAALLIGLALSLKQTNEIKVDLDKDENNVKDIAKNPATNIEEEDEKMQEEHEPMKISENETIAKSQTKAEIALEHLDNKNFVVHPPIDDRKVPSLWENFHTEE